MIRHKVNLHEFVVVAIGADRTAFNIFLHIVKNTNSIGRFGSAENRTVRTAGIIYPLLNPIFIFGINRFCPLARLSRSNAAIRSLFEISPPK